MPSWFPTFIVGLSTAVVALVGIIITAIVGQRKNNVDAAAVKATVDKDRSDGQIQYANSVLQFADRKDIEINRLTIETTAQAVRITTLEAQNTEKDRRIQVLTQEGDDRERKMAKMATRIELLEDMVEGLREMFKRSMLPGPGQTAGTVMGMAMGMATINPTQPQTPSPTTPGTRVSEDTADRVDITADVPDSDPSDSQPPATGGNGKTGKPKRIAPKTDEDDTP